MNTNTININNYMTIEALEDGLTVTFSYNTLEYCVNGDGNWKILDGIMNESINAGQTLSFRGESKIFHGTGIGHFEISKKCNLKGNCMSLLFGDDAANNYSLDGKDEAFLSLFEDCATIVEVSKDFLPATQLSSGCYYFMFRGCTSLTIAPELPATTLVSNCYKRMFSDCTNLNYIKMLATDISARCLSYWVSDVSSTGTFVKSKDATWNTTPGALGDIGVPAGWTVIDDTFPTNEEGMPESTTFEFPLYFNTEITMETDDYLYRERAMDDILEQYYSFFNEELSDLGVGMNIPDEFFEQYPIFIDGYPVKGAIKSWNDRALENIITTNSYGGYDEIYIGITSLGLWVDAYKF